MLWIERWISRWNGRKREMANPNAVSQSSNLREPRERTTEGQHAIHIHAQPSPNRVRSEIITISIQQLASIPPPHQYTSPRNLQQTAPPPHFLHLPHHFSLSRFSQFLFPPPTAPPTPPSEIYPQTPTYLHHLHAIPPPSDPEHPTAYPPLSPP